MTKKLRPSITASRAPGAPDANTLELFARIAAAGSFAQAARDLGLTRAAVSRRVAVVEAQLGTPLFARTTRALGLTEAGRRLATRARAVLDAAEAARRGLRARDSRGGALAGSLRVTLVPSFGQAVLGPLLAQFQALHPELRLELRFTHRRVDLVRDDIDVAFRLTRRPPDDCVATPVLAFNVHAYAAPALGALAGPQALAGQRCLVFGTPTDELTMTWIEQRSGRSVTVDIQPTVTGDDLGTLQSVAAAGGGVVFAPDYCVREQVARKALINVLPGWSLPVNEGNTLLALTLPVSAAPESARALVHFVRDALMPADRPRVAGR
ncbi:MAG TPA: LysR substrate-binding domain-containing protein [Rubrivivax sp.]|nr:LysR substrate-binding domain-containing protein [Rubrivivax sp.]